MMRTFAIVVAVLAVLGITLSPPAAQAALTTDGYRDFQFGSSCNSTPTGEKPESKLWWNDGSWWGSLCATDNHYHIFRLDLGTQKWIDTGTMLDDRPTSKADTLWDSANKKLYVASHIFTTSPAPTSTQSNWGRLYRYSYNAGIYTLDTGFPVTVSKGKSESMVLAKASNGVLWVTYVESNKVMINHSSGSDASWGVPYPLPVTGASNLSSDDIAANIAFDTTTTSPKIGVLWSNQNDKKMYFASHADADQDDQTWVSFSVFTSNAQNPAAADDHMNMKLQSDGRGVYAVTKTSNTNSAASLIVLVSCSANCAAANSWTIAEVYKKADNQTRAILLIDTSHGELNVFSATEGGGSIYRKKSPITNPSFPTGLGDQFVFIRKTASDAKINNPTSTKQNVDSTTGLVVLASDEVSRYYLHNYDPLGGSAPVDTTPPTVTNTTPANNATNVSTATSVMASFSEPLDASSISGASFTLSGPSGAVGATVTYSSGTNSATLQPTSALAAGASYTAQVSGVKDLAGNVLAAPYSWSFSTAAAPSGGSTFTFGPVADTYVSQASPSSTYATSNQVQAVGGSSAKQIYIRFTVNGLPAGALVSSARLRLYVTNDSTSGGIVQSVSDTAWPEALTWSGKPAIDGPVRATLGAVGLNTTVEVDLGGAIAGNGSYSFAITLPSGNTNTVGYASRENSTAANRPQLLIVTT